MCLGGTQAIVRTIRVRRGTQGISAKRAICYGAVPLSSCQRAADRASAHGTARLTCLARIVPVCSKVSHSPGDILQCCRSGATCFLLHVRGAHSNNGQLKPRTQETTCEHLRDGVRTSDSWGGSAGARARSPKPLQAYKSFIICLHAKARRVYVNRL